MKVHDLKKVERLDMVIDAPIEEVSAFLSENCSNKPFSKAAFRGTVRGKRFTFLKNKMGKRNIRPKLKGLLRSVEGGRTEVSAQCELPWWGTYLGKGLLPYSFLFTFAWLGMAYATGMLPPLMLALVGVMLLITMPMGMMAMSGMIVNEAVEERAESPAILAAILAEKWPAQGQVEHASEDAREDALAAMRAIKQRLAE